MHMLLILLTLCLRKPDGISRLFSIAYAFAGNGCNHGEARTMVVEHLGTNHADEITLSPETHAQDTLPLSAGNGAIPYSATQPLTNDPIRRALDALGIP